MIAYSLMGPYECNDRHSIVRDDPAGGDPLTVITIARIHRRDELLWIINAANGEIEGEEPALADIEDLLRLVRDGECYGDYDRTLAAVSKAAAQVRIIRAYLAANRAADDCACGGGDVSGHDSLCPSAHEDRSRAVLIRALSIFLGEDDRFQVAVGGNPSAVEAMLAEARAALASSREVQS